jgi:hypothetical protein
MNLPVVIFIIRLSSYALRSVERFQLFQQLFYLKRIRDIFLFKPAASGD